MVEGSFDFNNMYVSLTTLRMLSEKKEKMIEATFLAHINLHETKSLSKTAMVTFTY